MRGNYGKGKSSTQRIKQRMLACEGLDRRMEIPDPLPDFSGSTIRQLALHNGLKWPLRSTLQHDSNLCINSSIRPFILILTLGNRPMCFSSDLGVSSLRVIVASTNPDAMAELNL